MSTVDKNQAMLDFLQTHADISGNNLFFNFGEVENNAHMVITRSDDVSLQKPYIDGSVSKRYTCALDTFKSVAYNSVVQGYSAENVEEYAEVQELLDWINQCGDEQIYPVFGDDCFIDSMKCLTTKPEMVGLDTKGTPAIAVYRVSIQIDYLDTSLKLFK